VFEWVAGELVCGSASFEFADSEDSCFVCGILLLCTLAVGLVILAEAFLFFSSVVCHSVAQAVTHSPSTIEPWVKLLASQCGIYCKQSGTVTGFVYGYFGFSLSVSLHWCSTLMHLPVTNSIWCDHSFWTEFISLYGSSSTYLLINVAPLRSVSLELGSMSPVIAHPFPVKCIVCNSGCSAIVRDSSLSKAFLFSFKLSLSFWKGKTLLFFNGQKFMHKQSSVGRCRTWIWQQSDTCSYCLSACAMYRPTGSPQHLNFTDSESSVLKANSYPLSNLWSVLLVEGHPKHWASSTEVTLLMNLENHPETCILLLVCYPKATCNILEVYLAFFPSWKQYLIPTPCSFKSTIFQMWQDC